MSPQVNTAFNQLHAPNDDLYSLEYVHTKPTKSENAYFSCLDLWSTLSWLTTNDYFILIDLLIIFLINLFANEMSENTEKYLIF